MKRVIDIVVASVVLLLLAPFLLVGALLVLISIGRPVFFTQKRPGLNCREFMLVKLRTMRTARDEKNHDLPDAQRVTKAGLFLRVTSIDELPQLWNVIIGDMSLIGPRPLLMEYLPLYSFKQNRRHEVRPGITGWAQVNGRNQLSWEKKFELDVWYVDNRSFWLDCKILFMTLVKVATRSSVSADGEVTVTKFTGTNT